MLSQELLTEFNELVKNYPEKRAALIPALHRCQEEMGGWISPEIMEVLAEYFELEPVEVYGVASFYPMFHLEPVGKHVIGVCRNISCDLRGAQEILDHVRTKTGCLGRKTSEDQRFTVEALECQGACCDAPMMVVNGEYHENLDLPEVDKLLGGLA